MMKTPQHLPGRRRPATVGFGRSLNALRRAASRLFRLLVLSSVGSGCGEMRAGSRDVDATIVLTHKVDLGSADDPGTFHHRAQVAFWSPVGYAVGPTFEPGFIYVYDANGNWLRRLGGPGAGPGEIGPAVLTHLRVLQDTLWVAVPGRRRLTGFPADGGPPVTLDGPVVTRGFLIGPSQIIVNIVKEGIPTLAFLDREGRVHSEVASDSTTLRQGGQQSITGDGTDGRLWVGKVTPYDIEQWAGAAGY
jgi:hypothetical protein